MTTWTRYSTEPQNRQSDPTMHPAFASGVLRAIQDPRIRGYLVPGSVPIRAVDTPYVTELPVSPQDGDEVYFLADPSRGFVWHLRYQRTAPTSFLWNFAGGGALVADTVADQGTTSTSYADIATVGPTVTIPLGGEYTVSFGAHSYSDGANSNFVSPALGTSAFDVNSSQVDHASANKLLCHARTLPATTLNRGDTVTLKYKVGAGSGQFRWRWLVVTPIRVGRT